MHISNRPLARYSFAFLPLIFLWLFSCSTPVFIDTELDDGVYGRYFDAESSADVPGVLLLMGGSGYAPVYDELAKSFVASGYDVLILDYYGGGADWGGNGIDTDEDIAGYNRNVETGIEYLGNHEGVDGDHLAIVGFSYQRNRSHQP